MLGDHLDQRTVDNEQLSVPTEAGKDRVSCGAGCKRNSICGDATLSLERIFRHRYTAHSQQLHANRKSNQKAPQADICNVFKNNFHTESHASCALPASFPL